jgi:hypothetical protein
LLLASAPAVAAPRLAHRSPKPPAPTWEQLGNLESGGRAKGYNPSLAAGPHNELYVAWDEGDEKSRDVYVRRWEGKAWHAVGGKLSAVSAAHTDSTRPALAVDSKGMPWVAWMESDGQTHNIYVAHFTNGRWEELGGSQSAVAGARTDAYNPALAIDAHDRAYLAWSEYDGEALNVYVRAWDGKTWQPLGAGLSAVGGSTHARRPALAVRDGHVVVAWTEGAGQGERVQVRRWEGQRWEKLESPDNAVTGPTAKVALALGLDGSPYVAFSAKDGVAKNIHAWRWEEHGWAAVGGALSAVPEKTDAVGPSLALVGAQPFLAWTELGGVSGYRVYTAQWAKNAWKIGPPLSATEGSGTDALTVSAVVLANGEPVLAWSQRGSNGVSLVTVWRLSKSG